MTPRTFWSFVIVLKFSREVMLDGLQPKKRKESFFLFTVLAIVRILTKRIIGF